MGLFSGIARDLGFLRDLLRTLKRVQSISTTSRNLACDDIEAAVKRWPRRPAMTFEGKTLTFAEFDQLANRFAHWARAQHVKRGDTVAIFLPNRLEYVAAWYGLTKVGVISALINNHLAGEPLAHCLKLAESTHAIVDFETSAVLAAAKPILARPVITWTLAPPVGDERDLTAALKAASAVRPARTMRAGLTAKDTALYIFTSGTTGLPKAARVTHMRTQLYMRGFAGSTNSQPDDKIYCVLPLYHSTGGLCAVGAALLNGGEFIIGAKFSASNFWDEVIAAKATMFVYIGELCRYLANQPPKPQEQQHHIRLVFGNGMRPDVWKQVLERFRIPRVLEFYGATEGNVSMFNFDGKLGAIGRVPGFIRSRFNIRLVRFDVESEEPVRGPGGLCQECKPGEIGECIGKIGTEARTSYTGYADKAASEKKILRDVFEKGDAWFATGDLMTQDRQGYFYFVDRIGDTFRWKSENVSTTEVAGSLSGVKGVREANVYGVAVGNMEGKAGMASLVVGPEFDIAELGAEVERLLPVYAQPVFVRLQPEIETTGTFKYRKIDLVRDGFDPDKIKEPLYYKAAGQGYLPLTKAIYGKILAGEIRL